VNCVCGTLRHEMGSVRFAGRTLDGMPAHERTRLGLARSFQLPRPFNTLTLAENLHIPLLYAGRHDAQPIEERCTDLLRLIGLAAKAAHLPRDLTQIEMRKLELARAMAASPRLLIADEAMAGLSHGEVDDILELLIKLNEQGVTVILIEHIMRAVMHFSQRLVVLVAGRKIADGEHLHGHEFQVVEIDGTRFPGAVRDTVLVTPGTRVVVAFEANNPGLWAMHCHLLYHLDAGMFTTLRYV
jgi:branched-chain amino acid transport system ATP-binding protein